MSEDKQQETGLVPINPEKAIEGKQKKFTEKKYREKLFKYAKKIGSKIAYYSLLLFYAFKDPETPKSAKLTIAGALGYLILPVDLIPDFIPVVGFTDDATVIIYAVYQIIQHIDVTTKQQAHQQMKKLFGTDYDQGDIEEQFK
ncbi:YkvA family protein [Virgibacillus ainsalahensis]